MASPFNRGGGVWSITPSTPPTTSPFVGDPTSPVWDESGGMPWGLIALAVLVGVAALTLVVIERRPAKFTDRQMRRAATSADLRQVLYGSGVCVMDGGIHRDRIECGIIMPSAWHGVTAELRHQVSACLGVGGVEIDRHGDGVTIRPAS